jgi:hypothetical protein
MTHQLFSLQPFAKSSPDLQLTGNITRQENCLQIQYQLRGDRAAIAFAPAAETPTRQHELWEATCFEFFLGIQNSPPYWEFNLSPAGHWNVYRFSNYRQGMQEEMAIASLPFLVQSSSEVFSLDLELDLDKIVPANQPLQVGITTVIKTKQGEVSYWALSHPAPQPDFHQRASFLIEL